MDTQTQIDRLIELAIIQRSELKQLVEQLPQLREHLNAEVEKVFDETEPQLRAELEEWTTKQTADKTAALGVALEAKIADLAKSLEVSTQARYNAIIAEREENARLAAQAEAKIAEHAASLPSAVKDIVTAELARFPRAGEIDQLRKEFAEPRGLNPRGKWQAGETYNKLDLVTINGDSYTSNTDGNRTRPSRSSADWTLVAARGTGGGGGPTSLSELTTVPSDGDVLIGSGTSWVTSNLTAGAGISITVGPGAITISATDGDITLDDGTAASPSLHFTNDPDTGIYRPAANTLGISTSGVQRMYVDANGITTVGAGATFDGSVHAANGNANNPSLSFTGDDNTGFFRHQPDEIGITLGGTQKATLTSTTFSITPNLSTSGNLTVSGTGTSSFAGNLLQRSSIGVGAIASIGTDTGSYSVLRVQNTAASGRSFDIGTAGSGDATLGSKLYIYDNTAAATRWTMDSSGNIAQTGNLTVSGTGTSSVAGNWFVGTTTAAASGARLQAQLTGTDGTVSTLLSLRKNTNAAGTGVAIDFTPDSTDNPLAKLSAVRTSLLNGYTDFRFSTWNGSALSEQLRLVGQTGNLIIGSSFTDGGQKLQVSGTAYVSGTTAIGGGLDVAGTIATNTNMVLNAYTGAGNIVLKTNTTTALTLDSSQNATFAGRVTSNGTGFGVGADSTASTPFYALSSVNGTFGTLVKNTNAGSGAFAGVFIEADSGQASVRQHSTAHSVWPGKTLISAPSGGTGLVLLTNGAGDAIDFWTNATQALSIDASQNIVPGTAALATTATNGFIYLQTCAGAPTGVPTTYTGRVASIYDTTNNKLYVYNGGWKSVILA